MVVCRVCGEDNPERARFCLNCAAPLMSDAPKRDVRKSVTVLFADVRGSTALGEELDAESVRALMSRYFVAIRHVVESHGGTVEKFIGDAVMAVFGIPTIHEDDALRAVRAAAEIQATVSRLNSEPQTGGRVPLTFRIGVNTGEVIAGDPASGQTLVTGDPVNTAARLEQAAGLGDILLGEATYNLVRDAVRVEPSEPIAAKGKNEPVRAYRLVQVTGSAGHARRLDARMVGRDAELVRLEQAFAEAVKGGTCHLLTLLGTAGIGKSRLVAEFRSALDKNANVLSGHCLSYGEGITYWPLAELVREAAAIDEGDSPKKAQGRVAALLEGQESAKAVTAAVCSAIGLSTEAVPQEEIFWAVRMLLTHLARSEPLVVMFEDIHWAEPTFLDLIEHVTDLSRGTALVILCSARPELLDRRDGWGGAANATTMRLEPLAEYACDQLIGDLPGGSRLPHALRDRILVAAEGNPLYLEEMLAMLADEGLLVSENGGWLAAPDLDTMFVPPTIQALLAARLEQLPATERTVAEGAAVIGRTFEAAAVVELTPDAVRREVAPSLAALVRKELIRPERSELMAGDTFSFRHILIRDAAYGALPKLERAGLHERFARWLRRIAGDRLAESEEIVGYHFEQAWLYRRELRLDDDATANVADAATDHLAASAFRALDRSDLNAAARLLGRALAIMPQNDPRFVEATVERVDVLTRLGRLEEAKAVLEALRDLAAVQNDARRRAWWELAQLRVATEAGAHYEIGAASSVIKRAMAEFARTNDVRGFAHAWLSTALIHWWQLEAAATFAALHRALDYSRKAGRRSQELGILEWLALTHRWGPSPIPEALAELDRIQQAADGDRRIDAAVRLSRATLFAMAGQGDDAERELRASLDTYGELSMAVELGAAGEVGYWLGLGTGDLDQQRSRLEEGNRQLEAAGAQAILSTNLGLLAFMLLDLGQLEEAKRVARRGLSIAQPADVSAIVTLRLAMASFEAQRGNAGPAVEAAEELIGRVSDSDCHPTIGDWLSRAAQIHVAAGNQARARSLFGAALQRYRQKGANGLAAVLERRIASLPISSSGPWPAA